MTISQSWSSPVVSTSSMSFGSALSAGSVLIGDVQDRMNRRHDVATSKFDQAMGGLNVETPDSSDVDALLDSLKPKEAVTA